jgi:peptidoglycan/LPS O-acetylase OafA/YrhL
MTSKPVDSEHSKHLTHPKYRPDIDGLRAVAVLSVMGFHAFPGLVKGGFIGVDIFFVISGYLISTIIFENLAADNFSFFEFYTRRVRRIFPALLIVLLACLAFGWYALLPDEFTTLGKQTAAGAGFVSNFVLWSESGYFDVDAIRKPLLHLWSLGIEEQYYIVWPLLLWSLWKKRLNLLVVTSVLCAASFALNLWQIKADPVAAFYSPLTRFFELLIGSSLAYLTLHGRRAPFGLRIGDGHLQSFGGVALLAAGLLLITKERAFPGWWALLPTVGAALIISAGAGAWPNRAVLSSRALVWVGLISFPLYLWHWPILSFATIVNDELPSRTARAAAMVVAIALAWLTYFLLERPARFGAHRDALVRTIFFLMIATGVSALVLPTILRPALSPAQSAQLTQLTNVSGLKNDIKTLYGDKPCMRYEKEQTVEMFVRNGCVDVKHAELPTVFLIGDSHSGSLALGLRPLLEARGVNMLQVSTGWCEPTSNDESDVACQSINAMVADRIRATRPDVVIIDSNWLAASSAQYYRGADYAAHFTNYLTGLKSKGAKRIVVVGQIPTWKNSLPAVLIRRYVMKGRPVPPRTHEGIQPESIQMDSLMRSFKLPDGVSYLSVKDALCNEAGCLTAVGPDLESDLVVWDYGHLTPRGAAFVSKKLFDGFEFADRGATTR